MVYSVATRGSSRPFELGVPGVQKSSWCSSPLKGTLFLKPRTCIFAMHLRSNGRPFHAGRGNGGWMRDSLPLLPLLLLPSRSPGSSLPSKGEEGLHPLGCGCGADDAFFNGECIIVWRQDLVWWVRATPTVELALWMRHKIDGKQDVTDFSDVPALQSTLRFFFSSNQAGAEVQVVCRLPANEVAAM